MKKLYLTLLIVGFCCRAFAQAKVAGLGTLLIGKTKTQDLNPIDFAEYDQSNGYGKQYIVCDKIKIFDAPTLEVAGLYLSSVRLTFYEDVLCEINCDFGDELKAAFILKYGKGFSIVRKVSPLCRRKEKVSTIYNTDWVNGDIRARSAFAKWYNLDCEYEQHSTLFITSIRMSKPVAECSGANSSSITNRAIKGLDHYIDSLKAVEKGRVKKIKKEL